MRVTSGSESYHPVVPTTTGIFEPTEKGRDLPALFDRELADGLPHLAVADDCDGAPAHLPPFSRPKNASCNRSIAGFSCSPSTMTVRFIPVALCDIMCTLIPSIVLISRP